MYKKIITKFRKGYWLFLNSFYKKINFNHFNFISLKDVTLDSTKRYTFYIESIGRDCYCLRIIHKDKKIFENRKAIIATFDMSEVLKIDSKKNKLGLLKSSDKYGVFEYLGGGVQIDNYYVQDLYINLSIDITTLKIKLISLIPEYEVSLNAVQFLEKSNLISLSSNVSNSKPSTQKDTSLLNSNTNICLSKILEENVDILLYADISPNVIDGSSIWLTSIINILSQKYNVLVVFKDNINPNKNVISNIVVDNYQYLEPRDLGFSYPLNNSLAVDILQELDRTLPSVKTIITRGYDLAFTLQKDDVFIGRRCVYLTDFYSVADSGFIIPEHRLKTLKSVLLNTDYLLVQTKQIKEKLSELTSIESKTISLPPSLPHDIFSYLEKPQVKLSENIIHIGYAGKVQPRWGVEELLLWSEELRRKGFLIHVHIATGKIYSSNKKDDFVNRINKLLNNAYVTIYSDLDRFGAMSLMNEMNYVWCYRDALLENSTLEISTKLIEMGALGKPVLCYPSVINQELLSEEYPYYVKNKDDFLHIIESKDDSTFDFSKLAEQIKRKHSFDQIVSNFSVVLPVNQKPSASALKKVLIAGHDLKFINPWISYLKKEGYQVKVDEWEWGVAKDLDRSTRLLEWADIIFCEWGLANAVWYSQNNIHNKPLYIRAHAQEVREKARKFGKQIVINNVSKVIFVADHIRQKALELWQWPEDKTTVIPNFLLADKFTLRESPLKLNLGMVGIIPQTKRFDRAIDLLEKLVSEGKDAHLYIKGHRPEDLPFMHAPGRKKELEYYEQLNKRIEECSELKARVHFDSWGNDVAEWYQNIDFILSPSDAESFHYALADGVLSGCLPIVWNWDNADIIYPNNWIVKDEKEAIYRIETFLKYDDLEINKSRINARALLLDNYSKTTIFNKFYKLIFLDN